MSTWCDMFLIKTSDNFNTTCVGELNIAWETKSVVVSFPDVTDQVEKTPSASAPCLVSA